MRVLVFVGSPAALALLAAFTSLPVTADDGFHKEAFTPPPQTFAITNSYMADLPRFRSTPTPRALPKLPARPTAPRQMGFCYGCRAATPTNPNGPHTGPPHSAT